jgi:hypothetical protein
VVGVVSRRDILKYVLDSGLPLDEFVARLWSVIEVPPALSEEGTESLALTSTL